MEPDPNGGPEPQEREPLAEDVSTVCPRCGKPVTFIWQGGLVSEPHNVLVASSVLHVECWDEMGEALRCIAAGVQERCS